MGNKKSKMDKTEPQEQKTSLTDASNIAAPSPDNTSQPSPVYKVKAKKVSVEIGDDDSSAADSDEECIIIIDNGSHLLKAGFCGDSSCRSVFPPIVGRPRHEMAAIALEKSLYIGDEAESKRGLLSLSRALKNGIIDDIESMV